MQHLASLLVILCLAFSGCHVTPDRSPCRDVDCSGHGTCLTLSGEQGQAPVPTCACDDGYAPTQSGMLCLPATDTSLCAGVTCSGHGTCVSLRGQPHCVCDDGFELGPDGTTCPDPCEGITCSGHGTCSVTSTGPRCSCEAGYATSLDGLACELASVYLTYKLVFDGEPSSIRGRVILDTSELADGTLKEQISIDLHGGIDRRALQVWTLDSAGHEVTSLEVDDLVAQCRVSRRRWAKATFDDKGSGTATFQRAGQLVSTDLSYQGAKRPVPMLGGFEYPGTTFGAMSPAFYIQALERYDKSGTASQTLEVFFPTAGIVAPVVMVASGTPDKPELSFPEYGVKVFYDNGLPVQIQLGFVGMSLLRYEGTPADLNMVPLEPGTPVSTGTLPTIPLETSVSLTSDDGTSLGATLALPQGTPPPAGLPAVLMVNDVSAADRDYPYAPLVRAPLYQHLAAYLAHAGFASLRYDPRAKTKVSLAQLAQDAKAAYTALASAAEVDKSRVFVLSHGTSSTVALSLLKEGLTARGYAALAPAIQKLDEVLLYKALQPYKAAKCGKWYTNSVEKRYNDILKEIADGTYQEEELLRVPVSLWKDWLAFDGAATLGAFAGPVLVLRGDQDMEMPAEQVTAAEDAAKDAGKANLTAQTLPGLTFSFAEGSMDDLWESALLPLDLPPAATDPLLNWLKANK
jgi:fermentation-respiration switch protein FrsA (DUF1100 family)